MNTGFVFPSWLGSIQVINMPLVGLFRITSSEFADDKEAGLCVGKGLNLKPLAPKGVPLKNSEDAESEFVVGFDKEKLSSILGIED